MKPNQIVTRRRFVIQSSRLIAIIPFVGTIGCNSDTVSELNSEDSLKKLIYIIGPWTIEDQIIAEDFANRFLKTNHADQYLPKSVKLIQSLSKEISEETMGVKEINLDNIPKEIGSINKSIKTTLQFCRNKILCFT